MAGTKHNPGFFAIGEEGEAAFSLSSAIVTNANATFALADGEEVAIVAGWRRRRGEGKGKGKACGVLKLKSIFWGPGSNSQTTFFQSSPDATLRRQAGPGSLQQSACSSVQHHCSPGFRQQTAVILFVFPNLFFSTARVAQTFLASAMYTPKTKVCAKPAPRQQPSSNLRCNLGCVRREGNGTAAGCRIVKES